MQTTYTRTTARGLPGEFSHKGKNPNVTSKHSEGATAAGLYVVEGTDEQDVAVPTSGFTQGAGVVHRSSIHETNVFADKEPVGVADSGVILVAYEPDTAPTPNTPAFARHTTNGAGKLTLGAVRADSDSDNADPIPGGMFRRLFAADGLVELELTGQV